LFERRVKWFRLSDSAASIFCSGPIDILYALSVSSIFLRLLVAEQKAPFSCSEGHMALFFGCSLGGRPALFFPIIGPVAFFL